MYKQHRPTFDVRLHGRDVWQCIAPKSGITIGDPVMEEIAALTWAGVGVTAELDYYQRVAIKAAYRTHNQAEAVKAHHDIKKAERNNGRKRR